MRVQVTVVPVSIKRQSPTEVRLVAFKETDQPDQPWASVILQGGEHAISPVEAAADLLRNLNPLSNRGLSWDDLLPEPVMFHHSDQSPDIVTLVFTAGVPMMWADKEIAAAMRKAQDAVTTQNWMPRWEHLLFTHSSAFNKLPYTRAIVEHWRQRLEEQTAALPLLPRYFTMTQLRDVYQAVWGPRLPRPKDKEQRIKPVNLSNFTKWAERAFNVTSREPGPQLLTAHTNKRELKERSIKAIHDALPNTPLVPFIVEALLGKDPTVINPVELDRTGEIFPTAAGVFGIARIGYREPSVGAPPTTWYSGTHPPGNPFGYSPLSSVYEPRPNYTSPMQRQS